MDDQRTTYSIFVLIDAPNPWAGSPALQPWSHGDLAVESLPGMPTPK